MNTAKINCPCCHSSGQAIILDDDFDGGWISCTECGKKIYRTIADRIWTLKGLFAEACDSDIGGSLYQGIEDSQIRVYVYRS